MGFVNLYGSAYGRVQLHVARLTGEFIIILLSIDLLNGYRIFTLRCSAINTISQRTKSQSPKLSLISELCLAGLLWDTAPRSLAADSAFASCVSLAVRFSIRILSRAPQRVSQSFSPHVLVMPLALRLTSTWFYITNKSTNSLRSSLLRASLRSRSLGCYSDSSNGAVPGLIPNLRRWHILPTWQLSLVGLCDN